jgi:signal transduction histidine kinase/response regulator RpfG family c-di-GMP phosphodiesterase
MRSPDHEKPKILVVDDEPDNLDLLYRTFYREFKVLRAESGPKALEILSNEPDIAVIISDQRMPSMSGTEFLSLTATRYPDIIRIILTGYTDVEDLVEAINSGKVFKYVTKPWDDDELKTVVRQAVDTHNVLRTRTQELRRTLRQESLLNTIGTAIRGALSYRELFQTIVDTVGEVFEVDCCLLRPCQDQQMEENVFTYIPSPQSEEQTEADIPTLNAADLMATVWITDAIVAINSAATDAHLDRQTDLGEPLKQVYERVGFQSTLMVPLICQKDVRAVLALHQRQPRRWSENDINLIELVADQTAPSLAQAQAYEKIRALARREALVNTISTAIRSSLNPQDIFAAITQQLGHALHTDGCALSLWTAGDEYVQCVGLHDANRPATDQPIVADEVPPGTMPAWTTPIDRPDSESIHLTRSHLPTSRVPIEGNPVLQQLLTTQQPVIIDDLTHHPEMNVPDLPLRLPARALLVVPLLYNGEIIGSISLRQTDRARQWQPAEIELAQAVAEQAAIAVQQSRLYQTTRQQAEQLLELDQQKNELFQNISHEFRTPLTLTIGPLEAAIAQQQGLSYEQSQTALRNSRRLLRLVNQLLDIQRFDAGRMQPRFRPCMLNEFVHQIVESFRHYCDRKEIALNTDLEPCPSIYLDLEKFDKVIYNLLSNAMKFTPTGGTITVSLQSAGDHCLLKVQDSGIGIRPDQIPYLFDRFRQADGSANRKYEGSGLGLALVKKLVELHGGTVSVDSNYGQGTTFTIWLQTGISHLPAEQVIEVPTEIESARASVELADIEANIAESQTTQVTDAIAVFEPLVDAPSDTVNTILVVDDNPDLRQYVSDILRRAGYRVVTANNGEDGFQAAQTHAPQLVLTDLMMPIVSGLEMIQRIRQHEPLKGVPIILLTARADEDTRIEGVEQGADAYLSKPFNDRELLADVRNLVALKENERQVAKLNRYLTESVLKRFLPPSLVDKAAKGELSLDLRPEPRLVTIVFSDIIGFTQLSNTLRSRRVSELLNEYLTEMTHAIFDHGGTVDKFMGDAILAIFGAPEELPPSEQVHRAIAAARQMYASLEVLNERWQAQGIGKVQFRCGIHQGTAVVGMFGGSERADYTAIGPSVNIAARIQEAATPDSILISAAVADYLELEEDAMTKCSPLKLKGVDETVLTFAIEAHPDPHPAPQS